MADDLELALRLAVMADSITMERFRAADLIVETKPDMTPVSEADRAVERVVRERLSVERAGDSILGEEFGASEAGDNGRRWIIDPIDGTKNYVRGVPVWATLVALQEGEQMSVGVVSAPALGRRWWASRGGGAFAAEVGARGVLTRRLEVSGVGSLDDASVSFSGFDDWDEAGGYESLIGLCRRCWRSRGYGDFWSHMMVAEGVLEIGLDPVVSLWDMAAAMVIVEEAGGTFTDFSGVATAAGGSGISSNGHLHAAALAIIGR